jgi:hypothetical protein
MSMEFQGTGRKLNADDLKKAAEALGATVPHIQAILSVETDGSGFDKQHRPDILFEPHVFYRELKKNPEQLRIAVKKGLAYPRWGQKKYPRDSYPRLYEAIEINREAALRSASWGLGQIMGSEFDEAGYSDVESFVRGMMESESEQLQAMVNLILHRHLDDEVRDCRWTAYARSYNGAGFAKNHYDTRLAAAFKKFNGKPGVSASADIIHMGEEGELVHELQRMLNRAGFRLREDGDFGPETRKQLRLFQLDKGMPGTGRADAKTWKALKETREPEISEERASITAKDLAEDGSEIASNGLSLKKAAINGGVLTTGYGAASESGLLDSAKDAANQFDGWKDVAETFQPFWEFARDHWWLLALGAAVGVWYLASRILKARVEDHRSGKTL